jgi:hypothetical protein
VGGPSGIFGWLPGRRAATHRRARSRHAALAKFDFVLAELAHELKQLAEASQTASHDDTAAVIRETTATSRILDLLARGEGLTSQLSDEEIADAWQQLAASTGRARLLGQGPHRAAKLLDAADECESLQQLVDERLAHS